MKRRLYFEALEPLVDEAADMTIPIVSWHGLLPYRYATEFIDLLTGSGDIAGARERLALGILRSDGYTGQTRPGQLSLRVIASEEEQLIILKQFPIEEFTLQIERQPGQGMVEVIPEVLTLQHESGTPRLEITLDLFELLMHLADGLQPEAPEFQPLLEDLAAFKSALLLRQTTDLVLLEGQRREHLVTQRDGKVVRLSVADVSKSGITQ
jgi:hypothetical protein